MLQVVCTQSAPIFVSPPPHTHTHQAVCVAQREVKVRLESYSNPDHDWCGGGHCGAFELFEGDCDNLFMFCIREVGTFECLTAIISSEHIEKDELVFSQCELDTLQLHNPVCFSNLPTSTVLLMCICFNCHFLFNS